MVCKTVCWQPFESVVSAVYVVVAVGLTIIVSVDHEEVTALCNVSITGKWSLHFSSTPAIVGGLFGIETRLMVLVNVSRQVPPAIDDTSVT